jgi:hypothetical protein
VYAVSVEALAPLLEQSNSPAEDVLFTLNVAPLQRPRAAAASSWSVKLSSGETIDENTFALTMRSGAGTLNYPGAGKCATLALSERKNIDGGLTVYGLQGKELLRESMDQGRRQGPLVVTSAEGQCVLAAQFQRGVRHGYGAYFKDGAPWLIEVHREGNLESQHLVKEGKVFYTAPAGKAPETLVKVLAQYGAWSQWEGRLDAGEAAIQRWAKEADRHQRAGRTRLNPDQLHAFQREAVAAVEDFRSLVEQSPAAGAVSGGAE